MDVMRDPTDFLLAWPTAQPLSKHALWQQVTEGMGRNSRHDLRELQRLAERGDGAVLLNRCPSLRKYFADFLPLPFAAKPGNAPRLHGLARVRQLEAGEVKRFPSTAPRSFVPPELRRALYDPEGKLNRNAWERGLALAIKEAWRSGDLSRPHSTHPVSCGDLTLSDTRWQEVQTSAYDDRQPPPQQEAQAVLTQQFHEASHLAKRRFACDDLG